jgi:hypothetical protein
VLKIPTALLKTAAVDQWFAYAVRNLAVALALCPDDDPCIRFHRHAISRAPFNDTKRYVLQPIRDESTRIAQASRR